MTSSPCIWHELNMHKYHGAAHKGLHEKIEDANAKGPSSTFHLCVVTPTSRSTNVFRKDVGGRRCSAGRKAEYLPSGSETEKAFAAGAAAVVDAAPPPPAPSSEAFPVTMEFYEIQRIYDHWRAPGADRGSGIGRRRRWLRRFRRKVESHDEQLDESENDAFSVAGSDACTKSFPANCPNIDRGFWRCLRGREHQIEKYTKAKTNAHKKIRRALGPEACGSTGLP